MNDDDEEQQPIDPTEAELTAYKLRKVKRINAEIAALKAAHAAVMQGPTVDVVIELTGLEALTQWVAEGETPDDRLRRADEAKLVCAETLNAVDAQDFSRRLRASVAKVIQGSAN